jgi:UDP-N-acetylmuramoylalanine--D-glutamate ligase
VSLTSERAQPGEIVLLAPACASFDQFENFERRGDAFRTLVAQVQHSA